MCDNLSSASGLYNLGEKEHMHVWLIVENTRFLCQILCVYRIHSIRRRGYYLFHRPSLCGVYSRAAFINTSSCQRGNP